MFSRLLALCLVTTFVGACSSFKSSSERAPAAAYYVDPQYYDLQVLLSEALTFRSTALRFADEKKLGQTGDISLSRSEGEWVRSMGAEYLQTRQKLLDLAITEGEYFSGMNRVKRARSVSYGVSMGFGNMVGLVETRKGYLINMPESEKRSLVAEMKPLDILMEKTPFRLTDKMIPGHYGHVAIWLGTEEQLKELKVWDKIPANIQTKIRSGHRIVEALRPGVELNTLEHFLNIDDFLVVRDTRSNITDEYRREAILQAIAQIGKEYDFNFDVHTHTRIVCSEIAYVVYKDVKWPLEETLRRYTISPDNVAQLAIGNQRIFEPVIMYYDGKRVYKDLPYSLGLLLKADDSHYAEFRKFQNL